MTPTQPASKSAPKLPEKRDVPPGRPPKGYRWLKRDDFASFSSDRILFPDGRIENISPHLNGYVVGTHPTDLGDDTMIYGAFIRPLAQPQRAKKRRMSAKKLAWAYSMTFASDDRTVARNCYLAGFRAARRRAGGAK